MYTFNEQMKGGILEQEGLLEIYRLQGFSTVAVHVGCDCSLLLAMRGRMGIIPGFYPPATTSTLPYDCDN